MALLVVGAQAAVVARDDPSLASLPPRGEPYRGDPILSPALEDAVARGNIVVLHRDERVPGGVRDLQAGAPRAAADAGLAVLLEREPTLVRPVAAVSARRIQKARKPESLGPFIDAEIGRAAGRR